MKTNIELAKECGATEGWIAGEPAHHTNQTYLFSRAELDTYTALAIEQATADLRHESANNLAAANKFKDALEKSERMVAKSKMDNAEYAADKAIKAKEVMEENYLAWMKRAHELERMVAMLQAVVKANHEWHALNDEFGGYDDSELFHKNYAVLFKSDQAAEQYEKRIKAEALEEAADWFVKEVEYLGSSPKWASRELRRMAAELKGE